MREISRKPLNLLGLANRAGKLVLGRTANKKMIKNIYLLLLASDVQEKSKEFFFTKSKEYGVPVKIFSDSMTLGFALGFAPVKIVGFKDPSFAKAFLNLLNAGKEGNSNGGDLNEQSTGL